MDRRNGYRRALNEAGQSIANLAKWKGRESLIRRLYDALTKPEIHELADILVRERRGPWNYPLTIYDILKLMAWTHMVGRDARRAIPRPEDWERAYAILSSRARVSYPVREIESAKIWHSDRDNYRGVGSD